MAEAEEVLTDVARHSTEFAHRLWNRYREHDAVEQGLSLAESAQRLSLLVFTIFGVWYDIRTAQLPAPRTLLQSLFGGRRGPLRDLAVPRTDGRQIWLPGKLEHSDRSIALERYRTMALQQAMRARRGSAAYLPDTVSGLVRDLYLLVEAVSADEDLAELLPGTVRGIHALRCESLERRPPLLRFPMQARALENLVRTLMRSDCGAPVCLELKCRSPGASLREALKIARDLHPGAALRREPRSAVLLKDYWTGDLVAPEPCASDLEVGNEIEAGEDGARPRSSRLPRRPQVRRTTVEDTKDQRDQGIWMVQADEPHEKAEDPMGIQRPFDREDHPDTKQLGDMLGELPEARLVRSPGRPKEVLLSEDPPPSASCVSPGVDANHESRFTYPEWDYRNATYRHPGATVRVLPPEYGPREWVERVLAEHRSMLELIRRRFELLRARRLVMKRQFDGEEIDFAACIDAMADLRAGGRLPEELYQRCRPAGRDIAVMLLVDVSGSTDGWVASHRRIVDVEREALLLVCIALRAMGESYAVLAFSGEGPMQVTVRPIMGFEETFDDQVALRIAGLEPEQYTRAGAAIRHATAELMQRKASDRLLLLLSDGKPNDVDLYEGRYGIEDTRQAVAEARMQGVHPFCLTIDRQATEYLPRIFGTNQYAMLPKPELLPTVLLDWMRRLMATR